MANSGVIELDAENIKEVKARIYPPKYVKSTIVEGRIIEIRGKAR